MSSELNYNHFANLKLISYKRSFLVFVRFSPLQKPHPDFLKRPSEEGSEIGVFRMANRLEILKCQATIKLQCSSTTIVASCLVSRQDIEDRTSPDGTVPIEKPKVLEAFGVLPYLTWLKSLEQKYCSCCFGEDQFL